MGLICTSPEYEYQLFTRKQNRVKTENVKGNDDNIIILINCFSIRTVHIVELLVEGERCRLVR